MDGGGLMRWAFAPPPPPVWDQVQNIGNLSVRGGVEWSGSFLRRHLLRIREIWEVEWCSHLVGWIDKINNKCSQLVDSFWVAQIISLSYYLVEST